MAIKYFSMAFFLTVMNNCLTSVNFLLFKFIYPYALYEFLTAVKIQANIFTPEGGSKVLRKVCMLLQHCTFRNPKGLDLSYIFLFFYSKLTELLLIYASRKSKMPQMFTVMKPTFE
jgi:hypothetical protein